MIDKVVKYGFVGITGVLLVVVLLVGSVYADDNTITITSVSDWTGNLTGLDVTKNVVLKVPGNVLDFGGADCHITSLSGSFEGNGCTIRNFSISRSGNDIVGFIGTFSGSNCKISNVTISNFSVSGSRYVGGLVGYADSACTFENVIVMNGDVTAGIIGVGGVVGQLYSACTFENVIVMNCDVTAASNCVGGLVGYAHSASISVNASCVNGCDMAGSYHVGGLVGYAGSASVSVNASLVNGCDIAGSYIVGGIVGYTESGSKKIDLKNSDVANCVVKSSNGYSGGCLGCNSFTGSNYRTIDNCTVRNCAIYATSGSDSCGGIIGGCKLDGSSSVYPKVSNCTVEFCTIAGQNTNAAGGIAGTFPTAGTLDRNKVISSCIVSKLGYAAGICPKSC